MKSKEYGQAQIFAVRNKGLGDYNMSTEDLRKKEKDFFQQQKYYTGLKHILGVPKLIAILDQHQLEQVKKKEGDIRRILDASVQSYSTFKNVRF